MVVKTFGLPPMDLNDVMARRVIPVGREPPVRAAARLLPNKSITAIPVAGAAGAGRGLRRFGSRAGANT